MLLDEVYTCFTYLKGLDYNSVWKMPTYRRRYFLVKRQNEITDAEEKDSGSSSTKSTGKGTRSTTHSGSSAKAWSRSENNKENP